MKVTVYFLSFFFLTLLFGTVNAQNFSGLKDKELNRIDDLGSLIGGLISSNLEGEVSGVTVTYDGENKLKTKIEFTGFESAYVKVVLQNNQKKEQQLINTHDFSLEGKASPLELTFNLSETAPEGTAFESAFITVYVSKLKTSFTKKTYLFALNKKWKKDINPENLVIPISLEPVGSAANLKESTQVLVKPKKKPTFKIATVNPAYIKPIAVAVPSRRIVSPTVTKINKIDGTWSNSNKNTRGITKIIVSNNGKKIKVYGKCSPKDCDWGYATLSATRGLKTYTATFKSSVATSYLSLNFTKDLKLNHNRVYKTGNRSIKSVETFKKKQLLTYRRILPIKPAPTTGPVTVPTPPPASVNIEPEGPDNNPISLWDDLAADYNFEFPHEITNIRMDIYPDKNLQSGVFYYLPNAYHLRWNADEGYQFKMLYGTGSDASIGNIRMTGTLTPAIGNTEVALIKSLLESYTKDNALYTYKELKVIPLKSTPVISLSSGLEGQYNISADKIQVGIQSTITAPIEVSWVTDNRTKEEMQVALTENVGINGAMTLVPNSETIPEQLIPVRITLADTRTIGRLTLQSNKWRSEKWMNTTPYPIKLKYIHALIIEKEGNKSIPYIYSWSLGDTEVPALAKVNFNATKMPEWLEKKNKTQRIWMEYSIVDCESCVKKVMDELTGGTSGSKVKNITFETFQIFEKLDAALLRIKVRSKQADPNGNSEVELPAIRIEEDMSTYIAGPLYLPEGESASYEYFFTLVMNNGVSYNSDAWKPFSELEMFIGIHTLKESMSSFPEIIE